MHILLISTNRERLPDPVFPLGVAYVAGALEEAGHRVTSLDLCFVEEGELERVVSSTIDEARPDVVGLSLRNVDDAAYPEYSSYLELYRRVVAACRGATGVPLVVGGAGFTVMPEDFLAALEVDYGVVGEGERAMVELVEVIAGGSVAELPAGVMTALSPLARPRRPDDWSLVRPSRGHFSASSYYEQGGMLNLQTRRGCPHRCVYCTYPRIEGSRMRLRPVGEAVDEMERLVEETGARHLFMVDSVFNHPRSYAMELCDEMIRRKLDLRWSCYAQAGEMDGELIERMVRAGCEGVELGTDALVDEVLEALGKGFTWAEVAETSRLCRELGLRFCHFIFLGSPGEGVEQARLAVDRLASLEADSSLIMVGIRVFPGTALEQRARAELGLERCGIDPVFYVSPELEDHLEGLVEEVIAAHPRWVLPGYRRNFDERIQKVIRRAGKRGVLWDFLSSR